MHSSKCVPLVSATYKKLLDEATKALFDTSDTPRIDAEVLMRYVIAKPMAWLIAYGDTVAASDHINDFYPLIGKRQNGTPVAYLIGYREFWTLTLKVNQHVLIPRPDTEILVEKALERLPANTPLKVLDLGTGSGAIALSIAKERSMAEVLAVDYQTNALTVAQSNAHLNSIDNVEFLQSHWFQEIGTHSKFDVIVSNPPYVKQNSPHLQQGDLCFEPKTALIADDHGFADLRVVIETAPDYLNTNGWLIVEHGHDQFREVSGMFTSQGFNSIALFKDLNDLPRCTVGQWIT